MTVLILGSAGVIGQHMRLCVPQGQYKRTFWHRRTPAPGFLDGDLTEGVGPLLNKIRPDVVVNLACEGNVDTVERNQDKYREINVDVPRRLAAWCRENDAHLVHVSSQAVFDGWSGPFTPTSELRPINAYGRQKAEAEAAMVQECCTIVRPTFVLGVRPFPALGRATPVEQMWAGQSKQVDDRWFSPLFARDAAELLWDIVQRRPGGIVHLGNPERVSRYNVARWLGLGAVPVAHDSFPGIAPRPVDTTYGAGTLWKRGLTDGFAEIMNDLRGSTDTVREIALALGLSEKAVADRLAKGFAHQHVQVAADFRAANPRDDAALLHWYQQTAAYIWELSAYHADAGFNYIGMCRGVADRLLQLGARRVLCLGDGIGTLTMHLIERGIDATYHDLEGSRTADFAAFRYWRRTGKILPARLAKGWIPDIGVGEWDAIVSLDFMEHVTDVPAWVNAVHRALKPGGWLMSQNAFACGSGERGSIPMHLERNDRYEKEWDSLLFSLGFKQASSNWYEKPQAVEAAA